VSLRSSKDDCEVSGGETSRQRSKVGFLNGLRTVFAVPPLVCDVNKRAPFV
jgi:hypothetical protein